MSNQDQIYSVDEDRNHDIELGKALEELEKNPHFRTLILDGYLNQKVMASFSLLGVPQMQGNRGHIMEDMVAASNLQYWFQMVKQRYLGATDPILSDEEEEAMRKAEEEERMQMAGGMH